MADFGFSSVESSSCTTRVSWFTPEEDSTDETASW
jgi:hypothetical protein